MACWMGPEVGERGVCLLGGFLSQGTGLGSVEYLEGWLGSTVVGND